ncbi:CapA family protein [Thioclava atlantica]|uniref:Poly-gamma-glutamate synthesis protein n=1 Tax=Thioclava atlantica TaxID=1317124 RepID=A0A085U0J3_9RHOB|nr:CapA family protein [Thioclava atlantica]KFE36490.1 poly-gamma-glutamate synthesis protein [Thioclava atlantica]
MSRPPDCLRLFLAGDVMLGRGIDQIQAQSCDPQLFERFVPSAQDYVTLAERTSGEIPRGVGPDYVWGDLLEDLEARTVDLRLVNLETTITSDGENDPRKGIHYRMHPANVALLTAAKVDAVTLANNHMLDWGRGGLAETLATLDRAGIARAGAGWDEAEAFAPLRMPLAGGGRFVVFSVALGDSGVPASWAATPDQPGVACAEPRDVAARLTAQLSEIRQPGDIVAVSIHWGENWGYRVAPAHRALAEAVVGQGVDLIFGHSAHHPRAAAVMRGRLLLYGAGDLVNDYEGIGGQEDFRPELVLGYVADFRRDGGALVALEMLPYRLHRFRLERADREARDWLAGRMDREARAFGGRVRATAQDTLRFEWDEP